MSSEIPPVDELHPEPLDHPIDHETIDWDEAKRQAEEREETLNRVIGKTESTPLQTLQDLDRELEIRAERVEAAFDREGLSEAVKLDKAVDKEALEIREATAKLADREVVIPLDELKKADLEKIADSTAVASSFDYPSGLKKAEELNHLLSLRLEKAERHIASLERCLSEQNQELVEARTNRDKAISKLGKVEDARKRDAYEMQEKSDLLDEWHKKNTALEGEHRSTKESLGSSQAMVRKIGSERESLREDVSLLAKEIESKTAECVREYQSIERERDRYKNAHEEVIEKLHASEARVDKTLKLMSKLVDAVGTNPVNGDKNENGGGPTEEGTICRHCGT